MLLTVVSLVVVMLAMSAAPAFAAKSTKGEIFSTCGKEGCPLITPSGKQTFIGQRDR
jgi:hypothetical protein